MKLSVEQIEIIQSKHPDFDFEKFIAWYNAVKEELSKPTSVMQTIKMGCE